MRYRMLPLLMAVCLLCSGCSIFDGSYLSVTPHQEQVESAQSEVVAAADYRQLRAVVEEMVDQGVESGVIHVSDFDQSLVEKHMAAVASHIQKSYPIGAFAVEEITYEVGTNSGRPAIAVNISYRHSRVEIQRIRKVQTMENARTVIGEALDNCEAGVVLYVEEYRETDLFQIVEDYAEAHPDTVMETPQVATGIYGTDSRRVIELTFTYQTSREALRTMQGEVRTVFASAALYVSGEGSVHQKLSQLHGFLMERFDYTLETSITPAYSLLRHGVGDSQAFATVYAAMCRQAGLECLIVNGTRMGEPWTWNIVEENGNYYHVDILHSSMTGGFQKLLDSEMSGYVWDYSAYPECVAVYTAMPENTVPTETEPETTEAVTEETVAEETTENLE